MRTKRAARHRSKAVLISAGDASVVGWRDPLEAALLLGHQHGGDNLMRVRQWAQRRNLGVLDELIDVLREICEALLDFRGRLGDAREDLLVGGVEVGVGRFLVLEGALQIVERLGRWRFGIDADERLSCGVSACVLSAARTSNARSVSDGLSEHCPELLEEPYRASLSDLLWPARSLSS
jgi:hypothetical protein